MTWRRGGGMCVVFWAFRLLRQCRKSSITCSYYYRTLQVHLSPDALFVVLGWVTVCVRHCISSPCFLIRTLSSWRFRYSWASRIVTLESCKASNLRRTLIEMIWNSFIFEKLDVSMNYACFKRAVKVMFWSGSRLLWKRSVVVDELFNIVSWTWFSLCWHFFLMVTQLNTVDCVWKYWSDFTTRLPCLFI